ncbi:MAG: TonB-dependent receptor [Saprospiraceae bacterium]|nr:TonB-dependent receptor [Saprospiraceae bacterium]
MKAIFYKNDVRSILIFLVAFFVFSGAASSVRAQKITVSGAVRSGEDQQPLIGVSIREQGGSGGAITDVEGRFRLETDAQTVLVFTYTGFEDLSVPVAGQTTLDVVMRPEESLLQELVVTGYKREYKSDVSSAITSVKSKDIEKLVVLGIDQALQGQAAGVQITQTTGAPGDDIAVRIRGAGTLNNNNPLFIIDGVPTTGNINTFSTLDIESIEVLKDGAAAAIYGARAANGVVLITTKRGKTGKPQFSFDTYAGFSQPHRLPELLNAREYLEIRNEAINNANTLRPLPNQLPTYDLSMLDTLPDINWLDLIFNPAPMQRYALSASGGNEYGAYFIQGEYLDQEGIFKGQGFKKYGLRFNGETGNGWLKFGNNLSFAFTDRKVINSSGDGFGPGNELSGVRYTLIAAPVFPIYRQDGSYYNVSSELGDPVLFGDGNANPLAFIDATDWTIQRSRFFGNVYVELNLWKNRLRARSSLGGDFMFENEKKFKQRLSQAVYNPSSLSEGRVFDRNLVWQNTIDYSQEFGKGRISALAGMEAIQNNTNYLGASVNNFRRTDPLFRYIDNAVVSEIDNVGVGGIVTEWALLSYFGQLGYTYDGRYVLNATLRRDGSSRFGANNRWGLFPSVSAAWNVSNERFFQSVSFVSGLKFRASWGRLGNQEIGNYPYSSLIETGNFTYSFGDQIVTGAQLVEGGNANIRWETTTQTNFGMDLSVWGERLTFIVDYFDKQSNDILVRVPVPQSGGAQNPPFVNAAQVENKGWEFSAIYKTKRQDFNWSVGANLTALRNRVISIAGGEPILGGFGLSDGPLTKTEPGHPIGSFFLWQMEGIFQSQEEIDNHAFQTSSTRPGDVKFADLNDDGVIDDKDRAHLGNPFPDFTYGLNASLSWKNLDFSVLAQGVQGNDLFFLYGNFAYETQLRGFNSYRDILNRWTPENPSNTFPKVSVDDRNGNRRPSTRWLYDGSYLRLRNITLGYNFKQLIRTEAVGSLRAYATVQNAFTFTKYPGLDPEIQANTNDTRGLGISSDLAVGIDWGTVPAPRTFIFGIQMQF